MREASRRPGGTGAHVGRAPRVLLPCPWRGGRRSPRRARGGGGHAGTARSGRGDTQGRRERLCCHRGTGGARARSRRAPRAPLPAVRAEGSTCSRARAGAQLSPTGGTGKEGGAGLGWARLRERRSPLLKVPSLGRQPGAVGWCLRSPGVLRYVVWL